MKYNLNNDNLLEDNHVSRKKEIISSLISGFSAIIAGSCCIGPAVFVIFGTSIGTVGSFGNMLEPYRWLFLSIGYASICYSLYRIYHIGDWLQKLLKKPVYACACNESLWAKRFSAGITWFSFVLLIVATVYPWLLSKIFK